MGLGIPRLVDTAHQSSSFVRLYCSVGMTLANIETPLNWPPERAGCSVEGTRLVQTQKTIWRQVVKARADKLDLKIRALNPANPVYMAWTNRDQHSTMFASVIPTEQYNLKNEELWCAASTSLGIPNPVCIPHIGTRLVRGGLRRKTMIMPTRRSAATKSTLSGRTSARSFNRETHGRRATTGLRTSS